MKRTGWALTESLVLHGLLVGAMLLVAGALTPPPPPIRLDFSMVPPAPAPAAVPQVPAVAAAPPEAAPTPPAPQPEPAALPQKLEPAAAKVKHVVHPLTPAPQSQEQSQPQIAEAPAAPTTSAPAATGATVANTSAVKAPAIPADEVYRRANFTAIRDSILGKLNYPMLARRRGWSGQVEIAFTISPDGNIHNLRVLTSSGFSLLDNEALTAIRQTAPFSPPPQVAATLTMPITFQLN